MNLSLRMSDVVELFSSARWWELKSLRALLGSDAGLSKALGYDFGPDRQRPEYAFLASDVRGAKRLAAFLDLRVLVTFDLIASGEAHLLIHGREDEKIARTTLGDPIVTSKSESVELSSRATGGDVVFLNVLQSGVSLAVDEIASMDIAGCRVADRVVAFYTETTSARSAVSFTVRGGGALKFLVAGLAPGTWEIWRNGWLEDPQGVVKKEAGALYFEGAAGGYFFRRLS